MGGRPRRLEEGEEERRAQSRGEWPGVNKTFLRGFAGMVVCVGGGARPLDEGLRLGKGVVRDGGGIKEDAWEGGGLRLGGPRTPPEARWAEFAAGKEGICGS